MYVLPTLLTLKTLLFQRLNNKNLLLHAAQLLSWVSSIKIFGVAIFSLRKDLDVVLLDLQVAGMRSIIEDLGDDYLKLITIVEREFGKLLPHGVPHVDYLGEVNKKTVLIRVYRDQEGKATRVLIIGLRGGALRVLARRLEKLGWHRMLLFEIRRILHKAHADNY